MCIVFFRFGDGDDVLSRTYSAIVASNRDEFLSRPASRASRWPDAPHVFAGRDEVAHGTWLGVSLGLKADGEERHRWSFVTNVREGSDEGISPPSQKRSRGEIPAHYLTACSSARGAAEALDVEAYSGFNAVFCDGAESFYATNRQASPLQVEPGVHCLSNATLDSPWPKAVRGKERFEAALEEHRRRQATTDEEDDAALASALMRSVLRDQVHCGSVDPETTGCSAELEARLAYLRVPVFDLEGEAYGTRTSTVLLVRRDNGAIHFLEEDLDAKTGRLSTHTHRLLPPFVVT